MLTASAAFLFIHVAISAIAIVSGLVALWGMIGNDRMNAWTVIFLIFTAATSLTGFAFPIHGPTPALTLGAISLAALAIAASARYAFGLNGGWRVAYVVSAAAALYFNVFVLVVQIFLKLPAAHALAPHGSEPPFAIAQGLTLLFFLVTGFLATRRFRPVQSAGASASSA
jgi:hypothetical protein